MKNNKKGFTLIELLVVVLIIGILAAVALPQYEKAVEKSRAAEGLLLVRAIAQANERYKMANDEFTMDIRDLDLDFPGQFRLAGSVPSLDTANFSCRATNSLGESGNIAVCRRRSSDKWEYYFRASANNPQQILCGSTTDAGKNLKFCSMFCKAGSGDECAVNF